MANEEHLAILKKGVAAWNEWRKQHPNMEPDLGGAKFDGANFRGANFRGANFPRLVSAWRTSKPGDRPVGEPRSAGLGAATSAGAPTSEAILSGADLSEAILSGADLHAAILYEAKLYGASLALARTSRRRSSSERTSARRTSAWRTSGRPTSTYHSGFDCPGRCTISALPKA